jgi:hypothetical protein
MTMIPDDDNLDDGSRSGSALASHSAGNASGASDLGGDDDAGGDGRAEASTFEKEARSMGWQPEDKWDGPAGKWIDAKTFVERGEQILPILRANNKKMREELLTRDKDLATLRESLENANKAIGALKKSYGEATKREVEIALADLREQFKQAREAGDVDLELKVKKNLDTLEGKAAKLEEENEEEDKGKKEDKKSEPISKEFLEWQSENKWFGNEVNADDKARTIALVKIGEKLREEGATVMGRPFMDKCMSILEEQEKGYSKPKSKVESGGGKGGGANGRPWDSLPKEAKAACHSDNDAFVGPGKMFKTVKEWEDHYANLYQEG